MCIKKRMYELLNRLGAPGAFLVGESLLVPFAKFLTGDMMIDMREWMMLMLVIRVQVIW
jgi:hypothetical protein